LSRDEVTGLCALYTKLAEMDGVKFTKKRKRYNHMAEYVIRYLKPDVNSVCEAVMAASDDPIEGSGYKDLNEANEAYSWMGV